MKINWFICTLLYGVKTMIYRFIVSLSLCTLSIHSINAHTFQEKNSLLQNHNNLIITLQKELRNPKYTKEILPNDFSYFSQLITFGTTNNQPPMYLRSVVKSFSSMLKRSQYTNASAFSHLLEDLPSNFLPYFNLPTSRTYITNSALYDATFVDRFKATVDTMLYSKFSTEYESFRQDPNAFLRGISTTIVTVAQEELEQEQLRQSIIRFFEIALSKLVWDPAAHEQTWFTTKRISEQLAKLLAYNILDDTNDLEDLYQTLLNRYCYFIELTATDMPDSFFESIRSDLTTNDIVLFAVADQDDFLESKRSYMQRTLIEAETTAYRHRAGLIRV
jgi:hypothetical protein